MGNVEDGLKTRAGSSGFQYALERQGAIFQRYVSRIPNTLENVYKGRPMIMGHFRHTYRPISHVFYTVPITLVRFLQRYLPTPKSDVLYESSVTANQPISAKKGLMTVP